MESRGFRRFHRTRAQERKFLRGETERGNGFRPQRRRLSVWALVVTRIGDQAGSKSAFMRHHRVVPRRQAGGKRRRLERRLAGG
jgi:hypothetical protein